MFHRFLTIMLLTGLIAPGVASAQRVHEIRLIHQPGTELYRFEPGRINARAGETLQFTIESGGPYVVAFEPADFHGPNLRLMQAAVPGGNLELRAPALSKPGDRFRVTLPGLPAGTYRFYSVTHVSYRMAGAVIVR